MIKVLTDDEDDEELQALYLREEDKAMKTAPKTFYHKFDDHFEDLFEMFLYLQDS